MDWAVWDLGCVMFQVGDLMVCLMSLRVELVVRGCGFWVALLVARLTYGSSACKMVVQV